MSFTGRNRALMRNLRSVERGPTAIGLTRQFAADRDGTVALIFAGAIVPVLLLLGAGADFASAVSARAHLQGAVDSAALAAISAKGINNDARATLATSTFAANVQSRASLAGVVPSVSITAGAATVSAALELPTAFLKLAGIDTIPVSASGGSSSFGKKLELAMMLDITGSMDDTINGTKKLDDLKVAAADMLEIVFPTGQTTEHMRVALAPFSERVNVGSFAAAVTGLSATSGSKKLKKCVTERIGTDRYTDEAPAAAKWMGPYNANNSDDYGSNYSSSGSCSPSKEIKPLSADKSMLLTHINSFTADGSTAGHLGTAWAWYMLSPKWNSVWPAASQAAPYSDPETLKVAVLMTDGIYNLDYSSGVDSKTMAATLCTKMKEAGITVYTVGFGLPDDAAHASFRSLLTNCASPTSASQTTFFFPYDGNSLRQAFQSIGQQLSAATGKSRLSY